MHVGAHSDEENGGVCRVQIWVCNLEHTENKQQKISLEAPLSTGTKLVEVVLY